MEDKKTLSFLKNTSLIEYSLNDFNRSDFKSIKEITIKDDDSSIQWFNVYGLNFQTQVKEIIQQNKLDDFLINLIIDEDQRNKVIELDNSIFLSFKTLHDETSSFYLEKMMFIS